MKNSLQKRYQLNNSKPHPASSKVFGDQELPKQKGNAGGNIKGDSSGSERQSQERNSQRIMSNKISSNKALGSVAYSKHTTTIENKRRTLQKYKYINQLARLDYQEKLGQVYSRYTKLSKATAVKKIMAKNQIAEFEDQDEDENLGFDELIEFKYGKEKSQNYHFEKQEINEYDFCEDCDTVHNDHPQVHYLICQKKRKEQPQLYSQYSQKYLTQSLYRIKLIVEKVKSTQYQELNRFLIELEKITSPSRSVFVRDKSKILEGIRQLKKVYYNDTIFVKIIAKVCYLIDKL